MTRKNTRRSFLKTSAAIGAGVWVTGALRPTISRAANEQIQFACIGIGGKGESDSADCARFGKVVAICDVEDARLEKRASDPAFAEAKKYHDYRIMLAEMGDQIDAVTVSTPDHSHAPASALAMNLGKHCFTQKPLTRTVFEARRLAEIAREKGVKTEMGNQGTANSTLRHAAAVLRSGCLGPIKEVHVWTNRPIWPQGGERPALADEPTGIHWDLFLGPAQYRRYANGYHPFAWRGFWDFGTGALGDMACHTLNMPFMGLDLRNPTSLEAQHSGHDNYSYPAWSIITYEFPANDWRPGLKVVWYDGGKKAPVELLDGETLSDTGVLAIGEAGKLFAPGDYCENGHKLLGGVTEPADLDWPNSPGHFEEWVEAIQGGPEATSNFANYAGPLTETVVLGNLSLAANTRVEWDAGSMSSPNCPELAAIVKPTYREGYSI
jgi:predicted dehydrogenase